MTRDDALIAEMLLRLKAKSAKDMPWTVDEQAAVKLSIEKGGEIGVLAACCVLVSRRKKEHDKALEIVRREIALKNSSPYVELSIYEAVICINMENSTRSARRFCPSSNGLYCDVLLIWITPFFYLGDGANRRKPSVSVATISCRR